MNSGNPAQDASDHFNQIEQEERLRIPRKYTCDFCKRDFHEGGLGFEFEHACDDCVQDGTVKADFRENGMGDGLIDSLFIHAYKLEH